jgi:hypothetical protein
MHKLLAGLLGLSQIALGLLLLAAPRAFYDGVPGVPGTGPFNPHFLRDIGCAFMVAGAAFAWLARDRRAWPAALAGAAFLALHALVHVWDGLAGREAPEHLALDLPLTLGLAALALWLARPPRARRPARNGRPTAEPYGPETGRRVPTPSR